MYRQAHFGPDYGSDPGTRGNPRKSVGIRGLQSTSWLLPNVGMSMKKYLVINGPNLNMLGQREPDIYGSLSLKQLLKWLRRRARERGVRIRAYQSNHEGRIVDRIQIAAKRGFSGIIINPGALTHYSYAVRDAVTAQPLPVVEVHLSDIEKREDFRKLSVLRDVCTAQIKGLGREGYVQALDILIERGGSTG
jgi:3-dehydroquinate dehydratase-2